MKEEPWTVQTGPAPDKDIPQDRQADKNLSFPDLVAIYEKYGYSGGLIGGLGKKLAAEAGRNWEQPRQIGGELDERFRSSPYYEFFSAVDPDNLQHWIGKFDSFEKSRFNWSWNWPSFFFGPLRYFAKGLYIRGIIYLIPVIIISGLMEIALVKNNTLYVLADFTGSLSFSIFFGIMGSNDYFKFCDKYKGDIPGVKKRKKIGIIFFVLFLIFETVTFF